jgi:hypothetical protein
MTVDAIKWAMYRDSRKDRPEDGLVGWVGLAFFATHSGRH